MTSSFMSAKPHGLGKAKGSLGCGAVEQVALQADTASHNADLDLLFH